MSLCGVFLQHGAKRATLTAGEGAETAYRVKSVCSLTTRVDGQRCSTRHSPAGRPSCVSRSRLGWLALGRADDFGAALELRWLFTFCADAFQLKNSKPDPEIFLAACRSRKPSAGMVVLKMRRRALTPLTPAACARCIRAANRGVPLLPSTESLTWSWLSAAKRSGEPLPSFRYNIFKNLR